MLVSHNVQKKLPTLVINRLWTYDVRQLQLCSPANARHHLYNLSAADMTCTECEPFGCPQSPEKKKQPPIKNKSKRPQRWMERLHVRVYKNSCYFSGYREMSWTTQTTVGWTYRSDRWESMQHKSNSTSTSHCQLPPLPSRVVQSSTHTHSIAWFVEREANAQRFFLT